jgi:ribosomal protein S14
MQACPASTLAGAANDQCSSRGRTGGIYRQLGKKTKSLCRNPVRGWENLAARLGYGFEGGYQPEKCFLATNAGIHRGRVASEDSPSLKGYSLTRLLLNVYNKPVDNYGWRVLLCC